MIDKKYLENFIAMALAEDIGTGDITTQSTVPQHAVIQGRFLAKAAGVLCGTEVAKAVFRYIDPDIKVEFCFSDGQAVKNGDIIGTISGRAAGVLQGERLALNMMQRMSGIATKTSEAVAKVAGFPVRILDTRKVTPGLRVFEKYAVRTGGGHNHRFSLADGVLIKDNHYAEDRSGDRNLGAGCRGAERRCGHNNARQHVRRYYEAGSSFDRQKSSRRSLGQHGRKGLKGSCRDGRRFHIDRRAYKFAEAARYQFKVLIKTQIQTAF